MQKHLLTYYIIILLLGVNISVYGQSQSSDTLQNLTLQTITITAFKEKPAEKNAAIITAFSLDSVNPTGNFNLTDRIAQIPGVDLLGTGPAISKPVIRGSYGNRILMLLNGLKFDNQQWQDEHGLGLSDLGLSKVEIIKGPLGVLYGSEALGGVINLIEEEKPSRGQSVSEFGLRFNTNTLGGLIQGGWQKNAGKNWWRIRGGIENHADYRNGKSQRVLNSRFTGYHLKGTFGFLKKNWRSTNNLMSSFTQSGFIFNDIYNFITPDTRWSRNLSENPSHLVILNVLSSENKIHFAESDLYFNVGIQSNDRLENEGGGAISLNMHLLTFQYLLKWERNLTTKTRLIISHLHSFKINTNYGARKIIPDANLHEANASVYLETTVRPGIILENGFGLGEKYIKTKLTTAVNSAEKDLHPFNKFAPYYNFFTGLSFFPNDCINIKLNAASGVRIPNLAELSSNGLHEGIFTYEIGDPALKNEQNFTGNLLLSFDKDDWKFSITPFYNYIRNYVFLSPTEEEWFGFPVFRFLQQDAIQYGLESEAECHPLRFLHAAISYSEMVSKTHDDNYTPYIPAPKMTPSIDLECPLNGKTIIDLHLELKHAFKQDLVAPLEMETPSYDLFDVSVSTSWLANHTEYELSLVGNNLLDEDYFDHLSRLKNFGLLNMGRNFTVNLKIKNTN